MKRSPGPTRTPTSSPRDPAYGNVVCFCERVTAGEIRDAYASLIPPAGLDGLRRRTRAMNGRCQGFFCGAEVNAAVEAHPCPRRAVAPAREGTRSMSTAARTVKPTDVAIIGAGPAGLAAATRLAATHRRRVLVLDRESDPRRNPATLRPSRLRDARYAHLRQRPCLRPTSGPRSARGGCGDPHRGDGHRHQSRQLGGRRPLPPVCCEYSPERSSWPPVRGSVHARPG